MPNKMVNARTIEFLSKDKFNLNLIKNKLIRCDNVDSGLRREILNNLKTIIGNQEIKWLSNNNQGYWVDYLVYRYKFKYYPPLKKLEDFPLHLLLEPTSVCNLKCSMCFQADESFHKKKYMGMMDFEFFKDLVSQAAENKCRALTLASRGEPTLHKKFGDMLLYCKDKFFEIKINTNAVNLSEDLCYKILEAGVDIVVFSICSYYKEEYEKIHVGGDFKKALANIKKFRKIKLSKKKYAKTSTRVQGLYFDAKYPKDKFFNFWNKIVDCVAFNYVAPRWDSYNNRRMNYKRPCSVLWERMYVWYDGTCNPCDFDYKSKMAVGNAKEKSLKEIWLGEKYTEYRSLFLKGKRRLMYPCNRCNQF